MITLNGKKFAENDNEITESLFETGGTCVGYAKRYSRRINLFDLQHTKVGVINRECVLGCASIVNGRWWYSYADIDLVGKYESYMQERNELESLATRYDSSGAFFN